MGQLPTVSKEGLSIVGGGSGGDMGTAGEGSGEDGGENNFERHGCRRVGEGM